MGKIKAHYHDLIVEHLKKDPTGQTEIDFNAPAPSKSYDTILSDLKEERGCTGPNIPVPNLTEDEVLEQKAELEEFQRFFEKTGHYLI